jgi:hypothetical protein
LEIECDRLSVSLGSSLKATTAIERVKVGMLTRVIQTPKMQIEPWKTIRWSRLALILIPIAMLFATPIWYRWVNPTAYAEVRCVVLELDGRATKGFSELECFDNGKQTVVLRENQPPEIISPAI